MRIVHTSKLHAINIYDKTLNRNFSDILFDCYGTNYFIWSTLRVLTIFGLQNKHRYSCVIFQQRILLVKWCVYIFSKVMYTGM